MLSVRRGIVVQIVLIIAIFAAWIAAGIGIYRTLKSRNKILAVVAGVIGGAAIGYMAGTIAAGVILAIGQAMSS